MNLLVLDEPTNHLDLPAIEQLEAALDSYPGTLVLVTHDRQLLDAVTLTRRIELADGRISRDRPGLAGLGRRPTASTSSDVGRKVSPAMARWLYATLPTASTTNTDRR